MRLWVAKIDEDAVAHKLGDKPAELLGDLRHGAMIQSKQSRQVFGIEPRRERRGANQIAEQDCQLPSFSWTIELYRTGYRGRLQSGYGTQDALAVSEQYAELLEICLRQLGQSLNIDGILSKHRLVLLQTHAAQPGPDIQRGAPRCSTRMDPGLTLD